MPILTAVFVFAMQADSSAAPAGAVTQGSSALMDMMGNIGAIAICVLALLLFASLYSWTVILGKISTFGRATKESRNFIRTFRKASRLQEIAAVADNYKASPLAQALIEVYETNNRQPRRAGPPRNIPPLERSGQTAAGLAITSLERGMTWLVTIASTSLV